MKQNNNTIIYKLAWAKAWVNKSEHQKLQYHKIITVLTETSRSV